MSRTNFYRADPEIRALVRQIEATRGRGPSEEPQPEPLPFAPAPAAGRPTLDDLRALEERASPAGMPDEEIDRRIGQRVAEAEWIMRKFLGHVRRGDPIAVAPLVLFDLDEAIAGCIDMRKLSGPWWRSGQGVPGQHTSRKHTNAANTNERRRNGWLARWSSARYLRGLAGNGHRSHDLVRKSCPATGAVQFA